jgi:hypothetical protein
MRQILHVFRKDVRRHWPEAAVSIALLLVHGWNEVHLWYNEEPLGIWGLFGFRFLSGLLIALVPIAWAFMFVRVIHAEPLVGDRQFWVTRPYEWKKLLAAKLLYALVFINIPMLVLQVYLLAKVGFNPLTYAFGLVWMHGLIALFFLLPVAAVAVVTSSVIQVLLTTLVIAVYLIGMALISGQIPSASFSFWVDGLQADIFIGNRHCVGHRLFAICSARYAQIAMADWRPRRRDLADTCCYPLYNPGRTRISTH